MRVFRPMLVQHPSTCTWPPPEPSDTAAMPSAQRWLRPQDAEVATGLAGLSCPAAPGGEGIPVQRIGDTEFVLAPIFVARDAICNPNIRCFVPRSWNPLHSHSHQAAAPRTRWRRDRLSERTRGQLARAPRPSAAATLGPSTGSAILALMRDITTP